MITSPTGARVHTESLEMGVQELCRVSGCGFGDLLVQVVAFAWLVALALLAVGALSYVGRATGVLDEEAKRTRSEADALRRFRRRIAGVDATAPAQSGPAGGTGGLSVARTRPPDGRLDEVRTAYEETVMAVPHYDEEYGESIRTHLAAEFGEEIAHAVLDGEAFTPQLRRALGSVAEEGITRRETLADAIEREREAVAERGDALARVEERAETAIDRPLYRRSFAELYDAWHELEELETETDRVLAERQETLGRGTAAAVGHDRDSFHDYLYGDLEVTNPVLADGAEVAARLREIRRDVLRALTRRV